MTKQINTFNYKVEQGLLTEFEKTDRVLLEVNVVFGMPSKSCQSLGICKIEPIDRLQIDKKQNRIETEIILEKSKNLIFQFKKSRISEELKLKHFASGKFQILEAFELPNFTKNVLKKSFRIEAGTYPIITDSTFYRVFFH